MLKWAKNHGNWFRHFEDISRRCEPSNVVAYFLAHLVYSVAVAWHPLTWRSKGRRWRSHDYENRHGRMAASKMCCCGHGAARRL